ncbi:hypothetical protein MTP99_002654 [Tenebrio molitor]|jgi:tRNA (guanine9-N1)-methyltransferase|nr:hypothetical protein MTP99_002654 [Tenebrio molitor]CAH1378885.1 unnamed protein product [Tenebrio molitor]
MSSCEDPNRKRTLEIDESESATKKQIITSSEPDENAEAEDSEPVKYFNGVEISKLTKRQLKKYKKCLKWQQVKREKRAKERQRTKEKRIQAKLNNVDLGPSRKQLKRMKMKDSPCKIGVCIDLSFDELMIDKDMAKTIKQILRVYTENRRAEAPMQLYLTSFKDKCKSEMAKHHGYENWDINFHSEDYLDMFPKEKLIYLSSESDKVITELQQDKVYIIGGLVDHNFHKGICYKKALEQGIDHGQLPISEYFWLNHRKVLTINQVFEILLRVSEGKTFKEAFEVILPKRIEKVSASKSSEDEEEMNSQSVDDNTSDNGSVKCDPSDL